MKINLYVQPNNYRFYQLFARNINYRNVEYTHEEFNNDRTYIYILRESECLISNLCNKNRFNKFLNGIPLKNMNGE